MLTNLSSRSGINFYFCRVNRLCFYIFLLIVSWVILLNMSSCSSCNREDKTDKSSTDSTSVSPALPVVNYTRADSSLRQPIEDALQQVFRYSQQQDYARLGELMMYRGGDPNRMGVDYFHVQNKEERKIIQITSNVLNKWISEADTFYTTRFLEVPADEQQSLLVLEALFISKNNTHRKFFAFYNLDNRYTLLDISSAL